MPKPNTKTMFPFIINFSKHSLETEAKSLEIFMLEICTCQRRPLYYCILLKHKKEEEI